MCLAFILARTIIFFFLFVFVISRCHNVVSIIFLSQNVIPISHLIFFVLSQILKADKLSSHYGILQLKLIIKKIVEQSAEVDVTKCILNHIDQNIVI